MMNRLGYKLEKKSSDTALFLVSLAIYCSWCLCNFDLNGMFLDCFALCKCKLLTLHKSFKGNLL